MWLLSASYRFYSSVIFHFNVPTSSYSFFTQLAGQDWLAEWSGQHGCILPRQFRLTLVVTIRKYFFKPSFIPIDMYARLSAEGSVEGLERYNLCDLISTYKIRLGILLLVRKRNISGSKKLQFLIFQRFNFLFKTFQERLEVKFNAMVDTVR